MSSTKPNPALEFPSFTAVRRSRAEGVVEALRHGRVVSDERFDEIYPSGLSDVSYAHWTPVRVALRIVDLLALRPKERFLDVGAGGGKLCVIVAAASGAHVRGVERRPEFVALGREAAQRYGVDVELSEGSFETEDPEAFDALYIFNPFAEQIVVEGVDAGEDRDLPQRAKQDIAAAERFLERARPGTRLVTFCGFGGNVPAAYVRESHEVWDDGALELWVKKR